MVEAPLIRQVVDLAKDIFKKDPETKAFAPNFPQRIQELEALMNRVTPEDVGLDLNMFLTPTSLQSCKTAICHVLIYENSDVMISLFMIRPGSVIPLHNHPNMHGFLKCLKGTIDITSYTDLTPEESAEVMVPSYFSDSQRVMADAAEIFPVKKRFYPGIDSFSPVHTLAPYRENFHEIKANVFTPVGFLDVLAPPYSTVKSSSPEEHRPCSYLSEIVPPETATESERKISWLEDVTVVKDIDMVSEPYCGPAVE